MPNCLIRLKKASEKQKFTPEEFNVTPENIENLKKVWHLLEW